MEEMIEKTKLHEQKLVLDNRHNYTYKKFYTLTSIQKPPKDKCGLDIFQARSLLTSVEKKTVQVTSAPFHYGVLNQHIVAGRSYRRQSSSLC